MRVAGPVEQTGASWVELKSDGVEVAGELIVAGLSKKSGKIIEYRDRLCQCRH